MSIQDYKNATAKLKEFSEFYEVNRFKTLEEKIIELHTQRIIEEIERMVWNGSYLIIPKESRPHFWPSLT